jgi:hypothetical protein
MADHVPPTDLLSALERLLGKASPLPWIRGGYTDKAPARYTLYDRDDSIGELYSDADCAAIVALRNSAPDLIAEVRRLRARVAELEEARTQASADYWDEHERCGELMADAERWRAVVRLAMGAACFTIRHEAGEWAVGNWYPNSCDTAEAALDAALANEKGK